MMKKIARNVESNLSKVGATRMMSLATGESRLTRVYNRFSGKLAQDKEKSDIKMLEDFTQLTKYMSDISIPVSHPINDLAEKIRALRSVGDSTTEVKDVLVALENYKSFISAQNEPFKLDLRSPNKPSTNGDLTELNFQLKWQTSMRLRLLGHYMQYLKMAVRDGDIKCAAVTPASIDRIIDSFLLGTSSERLQEHMKLYDRSFTNQQLQDCFYTIFNAEVECVSTIFFELDGKHKHHKKRMEKYAKNYLLDNLELNTKSRCVFAWSDPLFTGFKPLPDEHLNPLGDLLISRKKYFKEGTTVAHNLMSTYTGERRMYYTDKLDTRDTLRMGFVFFVGTCILDWIICIM